MLGDEPILTPSGVFQRGTAAPCSGKLGQASHGRELTGAVEASLVSRTDVTDLGAVLTGDARGRRDAEEITLFDSTGLVLQDLAIAKVAYANPDDLELLRIEL